jgi:hypothetical protein
MACKVVIRSQKSNVGGESTMRVAGYVRVSTDKQAERGMSLEAQEAKVQQSAVLYELELAASTWSAA